MEGKKQTGATNTEGCCEISRSQELVSALFDENVPSDIKERVRDWLRSDASEDAKYSAIGDLISELEENPEPDTFEYEQLGKIHTLLDMPAPVQEEKPAARRISLLRRAIRVAAVVIPVFFAVGAIYLTSTGDRQQTETLAVKMLQVSCAPEQEIILPCGSRIILTSESHVEYAEDFLSNRAVRFDGEGYFIVTKYEGKDFRVDAKGVEVRVLGTEFGIKTGATTSEVSLVKGSVEVTMKNETVRLSPQEQLSYNGASGEVSVERFDPAALELITHGSLMLNDVPLHEALRMIERHFDVEMIIDDAVPANKEVRAEFMPAHTIEQAMYVVKYVTEAFDYTIEDNKVIVTAR